MARSRSAPAEEPSHRREVGASIKALREERGLSQLELAGLAQIHRPNLAAAELGKRNSTLDTLAKIAAALDVPLIELFRWSEAG